MTLNEAKLLKSTRSAYVELLAFMPPKRRHTMAGQAMLCRLLDTIAETTGRDKKQIQDEHEAQAGRIYIAAVLKGEA